MARDKKDKRLSTSSTNSSDSSNSSQSVPQNNESFVEDDLVSASSVLTGGAKTKDGNKTPRRFSIRALLGGKSKEDKSSSTSNLSSSSNRLSTNMTSSGKESSGRRSKDGNSTLSSPSLEDYINQKHDPKYQSSQILLGKNSMTLEDMDINDSTGQAILDLQHHINQTLANEPLVDSHIEELPKTQSLVIPTSTSPTKHTVATSPSQSAPVISISSNDALQTITNNTPSVETVTTTQSPVSSPSVLSVVSSVQYEETKSPILPENARILADNERVVTIEEYETLKNNEANARSQISKLEESVLEGKNREKKLMEDHHSELFKLKQEFELLHAKADEENLKKIKELEEESESLREDLINLDSRASSVKKQLEKQNKDLHLQIELEQTKVQLEKQTRENTVLKMQEQIDNLQKEIKKLQMEATQKVVHSASGDSTKIKEEFDKLKRWNEELNDLLSIEQQSVSNIEKERNDLSLQVIELKKLLEEKSKPSEKTEDDEDAEEKPDYETLAKQLEDMTLERDVLDELRIEERAEYEVEKEELLAQIAALQEQINGGAPAVVVPQESVPLVVPSQDDSSELKLALQKLKEENEQLKQTLSSTSNEKVVEKIVEVPKIVEKTVEKVVEKIVEVPKIVEKVVEKIIKVSDEKAGSELVHVREENDSLKQQVETLINQLDQTQEQVRYYEKKFDDENLVISQLKKQLEEESQKVITVQEQLKKTTSQLSTSSAIVSEKDIAQTPKETEPVITPEVKVVTPVDDIPPVVDTDAVKVSSIDSPVIPSLEQGDLDKIRSKYALYSDVEKVPQPVQPKVAVTKVEEEEEDSVPSNQDDIYQDEMALFEKEIDKLATKNKINLSGKINSFKELEVLCIKLKYNKTVKVLDLSNNPTIDNKGLKSICDMLRVNKTLTELYLEDTNIRSINPYLFDAFEKNYTITNILFSEDKISGKELDKLDTLLDRNETY